MHCNFSTAFSDSVVIDLDTKLFPLSNSSVESHTKQSERDEKIPNKIHIYTHRYTNTKRWICWFFYSADLKREILILTFKLICLVFIFATFQFEAIRNSTVHLRNIWEIRTFNLQTRTSPRNIGRLFDDATECSSFKFRNGLTVGTTPTTTTATTTLFSVCSRLLKTNSKFYFRIKIKTIRKLQHGHI